MSGAGELDRRIRIERAAPGRDAMGGSSASGWIALGTVWAKRSDSSDREAFESGEMAATRVARFKVRSSGMTRGITPADRVIFREGEKDDVYQITGTKEAREGRNRYIEITTVVRNAPANS